MSDAESELEFDYKRLWYIRLREDSKLPRYKWGGYSQDFAKAEHVHTHNEILESDWGRWAIAGIQTPDHFPDLSLLILDQDIYKADDPESEAEKVDIPANVPVIKTASGGTHTPVAVQMSRGSAKESDFQILPDIDWEIDIRGSLVSHHVVAPGDIPGVETEYKLVNDTSIPGYVEPSEIEAGFSYEGGQLIAYSGEKSQPSVEYDIPDEAPEDLPLCMGRLLAERVKDDHPNQFKIHTYAGMLGYALGYDTGELLTLFVEEYPYGGGADRTKTREHLERLRRKIEGGDLLPPAEHTLQDLRIIGADESCNCDVHRSGHSSTGVLPNSYSPEIEDPPEPVEAENDYGMTLEEIREKDDKLDRLLADVYPVGYVDENGDPDANKADWATAGKLWFWRFSEDQIKEIVRTHRPRVQGDAYLDRMVKNVCNGERYKPSLHTARRMASRNAYAVMGGGSDE